jgi:hypothetical protein
MFLRQTNAQSHDVRVLVYTQHANFVVPNQSPAEVTFKKVGFRTATWNRRKSKHSGVPCVEVAAVGVLVVDVLVPKFLLKKMSVCRSCCGSLLPKLRGFTYPLISAIAVLLSLIDKMFCRGTLQATCIIMLVEGRVPLL